MALFGSSEDSVQIKISTTSDPKGINDTESALGRLTGAANNNSLGFFKMAGAVAAGQAAFQIASVAVNKIGGFLADTVKSANDSENAMSQLETVLKSTGHAAGLAEDQLSRQATALQKLTTFSDEAVMGAQSLLLTFTNVKGKVFEDSIPVILDMSQALGQDLKSSTIQLGKALNDPIKGITALSRVGVSFTEQQKTQIETLVKSGKTMEAQRIILKELNTEFGGSAAAAGKTFAGSLERLKNQFDDVKESIGKVIVDAITPLASKAAEVIAAIDWEAVITRSTNALRTIGTAMQPFVNFIKNAALNTFHALKNAFEFLRPSLMELWQTIETKLWPSFKKFYDQVLVPLAPVVGTILVGAIWLLINALNALFTVESMVANAFSDLFTFMTVTLPQGMEAAFNWMVGKAIWLKDNFWTLIGQMIGFAATLPVKIPIFFIEAMAGAVAAVMSVNWGRVFSGIWQAMQGVWDQITNTVTRAWQYIQGLNWGAIFSGIGRGIGNALIDMIQGALNGALKGIPGSPRINLPHFEGGVRNFGGGLAVVGDVNGGGGEIVNLPRGSDVFTNSESKQMMKGMGGTTIYQTNNIYNPFDMESANRELGWKLANA